MEMETRSNGIILKDDWLNFTTLREFLLVQDLPIKTEMLNDFKKAECFRFVINLRNNKIYVKIINLTK